MCFSFFSISINRAVCPPPVMIIQIRPAIVLELHSSTDTAGEAGVLPRDAPRPGSSAAENIKIRYCRCPMGKLIGANIVSRSSGGGDFGARADRGLGMHAHGLAWLAWDMKGHRLAFCIRQPAERANPDISRRVRLTRAGSTQLIFIHGAEQRGD